MARQKTTIQLEVSQLREQLLRLKERGYVVSMRRSDTGIGYTLETLLGVRENNLQSPDIGSIELKGHRRGMTTRITLFTFNRGAWKMRQKDMVKKYGYVDTNSRTALYNTVESKPNSSGLYTKVEEEQLRLYHVDGTRIAEWSGSAISQRFSEKIPNLVTVYADTRINSEDKEEFWFNEAHLHRRPANDRILELLRNDIMVIDIRMHINNSGGVRNHGTGFRVQDALLGMCFDSREALV